MAKLLMDGLRRVPALPVPVPDRVIEGIFAWRRRNAGLEDATVRVGDFEMPYLVGGEGEPIVLLHGFGDTKDSFVDVARSLVRTHRVYLPDLPGFGDASRPLSASYTLPDYARHVSGFCDALNIETCVLGGNSLGGAISAQIAIDQPARVHTLILVCAAGLIMPTPSPLQHRIDAGENPFIIESYEAYQAWTRFLFEQPPRVPEPMKRYLAERFIARGPMHEKIMDDLLRDEFDLTPQLGDIAARTLVLWGDRDRLIDISVGHLYAERIADASLVVLHEVGHCPQYERPARSARLIRDFIAERPTR